VSISEYMRFFGSTDFSQSDQTFTAGFQSLNPVHGKDGKDGRDGIDGRDGVDGKDGRDGIDGRDGVDGKDGRDGIDGRDGVDGKDGRDGVDGQDGADGYTPVKGTDYWTEDDRKEMIEAVIQAIGLPTVTTADNGKILQVVNGVWTLAVLPAAGDPDDISGTAKLGAGLLGKMILGGV